MYLSLEHGNPVPVGSDWCIECGEVRQFARFSQAFQCDPCVFERNQRIKDALANAQVTFL